MIPKRIKAKIQSIYTDKWGNTYITIKTRREYKTYNYGGAKGVFEVEKYIPVGCRVERVKLIGG